MGTKFELEDSQRARLDAWFKHHWEVVHKGFRPRDSSGFCGEYIFGPTGMGNNVSYKCSCCVEGSPQQTVILTTDFDDGSFIYDYDENWNRLPASWEKQVEPKDK